MSDEQPRVLGVVLFPGFEALDVFGPIEMFGNLFGMVEIRMVAERPGVVRSAQGFGVQVDHTFADCPRLDLVMVPGGMATREEANNPVLVGWLGERAAAAEIAMTVCSGTQLLARTGLLDGRRATTNKMFFDSIASEAPKVEWVKQARWVEDGKFATSSGVSAGIDMALAVIARLWGEPLAERLALATEYDWHRDAAWDPFARAHGLV
jgi:transcriptional regulator GlxA family with amidase domain